MKTKHRCRFILLIIWIMPAYSARAEWRHLGAVTGLEHTEGIVTLKCGGPAVRIEAINENVIRVRLAPEGTFGRDFSWAVREPQPKARFQAHERNEEFVRFATNGLSVLVHKSPCRLAVFDSSNRGLLFDEASRGMSWNGSAVRVWRQLPSGASIYGLGEKTGPLNKRGLAFTMWNTDAIYIPGQDPLYQSIPFYLSEKDGVFHGVFFDNPWRSSFDFEKESREVMSFGAEGGELNYYVIAGPGPKDVVQRYTELTGRMELPPKWAIGYHQCRFSYFPESRVREIATTFREKKIPCDVLYFDIDYMDGYRCFTWDPKAFPNPKKLTDDLRAMGFHTVAIIDPGIKHEAGYAVYDSGTAKKIWVTKADGQPYVGRVWPGESVYPDFTSPAGRQWWASLFPPFLQRCGIDGIWNDMNEPSDFSGPGHTVPVDVRHDNEGEPAAHSACHNIYGMQMHRATREGLQLAQPGKRVFTMTRATYAGGQRYGAAWTGDNISSWDHLRLSVLMVQGLGVSGMPFVGPDIGGFAVGATPQLYARWIQVGSLFPYSRTHTAWDNPDQEPWSYGPRVESIARRSLERRYELMPYLYTLFEEASRTGVPIVRPMWMEFPSARMHDPDGRFMLGPELCVAPIMNPDQRDYHHFLPPGVWFDAESGQIWSSGQPVKISGAWESLPLFVRAGAIIPMQSAIQSTTQAPAEPLVLEVWPFGESSGTLYEDDGESLAYQTDQYRRTRFSCEASGNSIDFMIHSPEGRYVPKERAPLVRLRGLAREIESVTTGNEVAVVTKKQPTDSRTAQSAGEFYYDEKTNSWWVRMHTDKGEPQRLTVRLRSRSVEKKPVEIAFDRADRLGHTTGLTSFGFPGGIASMRVKETWNTSVALPLVRVDADRLPIMKVRLATEHARRASVRFATWDAPESADETECSFEIVPDGQMHDYVWDLSEAAKGKWIGTVYYVRIGLGDGLEPGEVVKLARASFEPAS